MGFQVFSQMTVVVEALLTNGTGVASQCFILLVGMFTDVMLLEMLTSVKASVTHSTRKAARLTMNGLSVPLQRFLASEVLVQRSHMSVSPCFLGGGGEGGGGGGSDGDGGGKSSRIGKTSC